MNLKLNEKRYALIIKGTREQAEEECMKRGIAFVFGSTANSGCVTGTSNGPWEEIDKWYNDLAMLVQQGNGYPAGTLLHWREK